MRGKFIMPEWLLWVLFAVVLLPVAALCLVLIYAATFSVWLKVQKKENRVEKP